MAPLSGVNPRSTNGAQKRASSAAMVKSAANARLRPIPAAQPRTAHTTGVCTVQSNGTRRWAWEGNRRWMLPTRGRLFSEFGPSRLRATKSNPEQKCSPVLVRRIARTASSRPARSTASIAAYIIVSSIALRFSGRERRSVSTPPSSETSSPGTDS